ncbi:MAG: flagellar export chaperone FliS [Lysobacter sp.]|nr:flagellar export chaperone FliS [Lysobacter sp.]
MTPRAYAAQYRQTAVSSAVLEASPHQLVALMFAGFRDRVQLATASLERGDTARKGQSITEAIAILGSLDGALDHEAGGNIATGLQSLYEYLQRRLVEANLHNDPAILREADALIAEVQSAWNAIAPAAPAP